MAMEPERARCPDRAVLEPHLLTTLVQSVGAAIGSPGQPSQGHPRAMHLWAHLQPALWDAVSLGAVEWLPGSWFGRSLGKR